MDTEEFERKFLESRLKRVEDGSGTKEADGEIQVAAKTRQNLLKVLGVALILSAIPVGYFASKFKSFGSGISASEWEMPKAHVRNSEIYMIPEQVFSPEAKKALGDLQAIGRASMEPHPDSKQFYDPHYKSEIIPGPVIMRQIKGRDANENVAEHKVRGKMRVVDYYEAAWNLLAEYQYPFYGNNSDFRLNMEQFRICPIPKHNCGNLTARDHGQGQGFDIGHYFTRKKILKGGREVGEVLRIFGFMWIDETNTDIVTNGAWDWVTGKKNLENVIQSVGETDFVHFSMNRTSLERMEANGGIEEAKKKARAYLESLKKGK